jgi:DNA-binding NtrC family response regulator
MHTDKLVLHVDDDPAILDLVRVGLENQGYKVISISDPTIALATLVKTCARVVILDIDMPLKDGLTLLREIKEHDAGIKTIMLTGMVSMTTVLHATRLGAEECVFKPVKQMSDVVHAVERCFANIESWWEALREWMERRNQPVNVINMMKQEPAEMLSSQL